MPHCPCGTGLDYAECCEPYVAGARLAPTAEALMRSRYSAYALGVIDYLKTSLHPKERRGFDAEAVRKWSEAAAWTGLEIIEVQEGGEEDDCGEVEFIARFEVRGAPQEHRERGLFRKEDGVWYFIDGRVKGARTVVREAPKVGRNDPCPCGSGKKFKKCCAV